MTVRWDHIYDKQRVRDYMCHLKPISKGHFPPPPPGTHLQPLWTHLPRASPPSLLATATGSSKSVLYLPGPSPQLLSSVDSPINWYLQIKSSCHIFKSETWTFHKAAGAICSGVPPGPPGVLETLRAHPSFPCALPTSPPAALCGLL